MVFDVRECSNVEINISNLCLYAKSGVFCGERFQFSSQSWYNPYYNESVTVYYSNSSANRYVQRNNHEILYLNNVQRK